MNPVNQLHVSHIIARNWTDLRKILRKSRFSEFHPQINLSGPGRAVTGVDFDRVARRKAKILSSHGRYVKTDIARFYASIYTHGIAWSILGKDYCKNNHNSPQFKTSYANLLDKAVGSGQSGQTIGIPIGPDTSRIISELIAVDIEAKLKHNITDLDKRGVRYVDDMIIGLNDIETSAGILSSLSLALSEYELELSTEKTSLIGVGYPHVPEWIHFIRTFGLLHGKRRQQEDLDSYFEQAFHLADANPRDNVLLFACKRASSLYLEPDNLPHLVRWLLYAARRSASCLSFVAEHLAARNPPGGSLRLEIKRYILQQLPQKAEAVHTSEVAWLLFWAREIGLKVPAAALANVLLMRSSVVGLLVLDLSQRGLVTGLLDTAFWQTFANREGLRSEMWLLAYEATRKGWWPGTHKSSFVSGHQFFGDLWSNHIEFYDPKIVARRSVAPPFFGGVAFFSSGGWPSSEYPI